MSEEAINQLTKGFFAEALELYGEVMTTLLDVNYHLSSQEEEPEFTPELMFALDDLLLLTADLRAVLRTGGRVL